MLAFYRELDLGYDRGENNEEWDGTTDTVKGKDTEHGNLVFLSARPHVYKDSSETASYNKFLSLRNHLPPTRRLHCHPVLLAGDLRGVAITWGNLDSIVAKKLANLREYLALYPQHHAIFIGDNGQGDVAVALQLLDILPDRVQAIFIHAVQPISRTYGIPQQLRDLVLQQQDHHTPDHDENDDLHFTLATPRPSTPPICFFANYVDAALAGTS